MKDDDKSEGLLKDLLRSSRNLPKRSNELGNIQLNLSEIKRQTNDLRKDKLQEQQYTKAHYLLAPSGITVEDIENDLNSIETHSLDTYHQNHVAMASAQTSQRDASTGLGPAASDLDISRKKDENILMAIEQSLTSAAQDFDNFINSNVSVDWAQRKNELRESFQIILSNRAGVRPKPGVKQHTTPITWKSTDKNKNSIFNRGEFTDVKAPSVPADVISPAVSYALRKRFETHAEIVYDLNETRQRGEPYPIALVFDELSKFSAGNDNYNTKSKQTLETWRIIRALTRDAREGQFAKSYNTTNETDFHAIALRKTIVANSRSLLESQFLDYINENFRTQIKNTTNNLNPSNAEKIAFFLEKKLKKNDEWKLNNLTIVNGVPIWATIFYLLRAGLYQDALEITLANSDNFQKLEKNFPVYLKSFVNSPEHKISQDLHERLHVEFNQYFKHLNKENDPYRYAVYKIIGRCDLTRKNLAHITSSIEDWLWVHLCFTREDTNLEDDPIYECYTLLDLQKTVKQLGASNFNGSSNNSLYLQVLTFVGLYELAVQYCYTVNEVDAVHLAIGLAYYGLIRPTSEIADSLLATNAQGQQVLNFAALLISYIRSFKISDPKVACEYLILVCLTNKDICHESLRKLVLETREFTMLLGSIDKDGVRIPGLIEKRKSLLQLANEAEFFDQITKQAALRADEEGRYQESILLYQLSKEYDTVVQIVNKLLGELIYNTELDKSFAPDNEIVAVAENLSGIYNVNVEIANKIDPKSKETCSTLLQMIQLRNAFVVKSWPSVLKLAEEMKVIPIFQQSYGDGESGTGFKFKTVSADFVKLNDSIVRNVPNLLIVIMTSLIQILKQLQVSSYSHLNSAQIAKWRKVARNCMIFAGLIEYKMPRETYKTLISLESLL